MRSDVKKIELQPYAGKPGLFKILIIDDNVETLDALEHLLSGEGPWEVVTTTSPFEALHIMTQEHFAVVISDDVMPLLPGVELLEKAFRISPLTSRILLGERVDLHLSLQAINRGHIHHLVQKAELNETLIPAVEESISYQIQMQESQVLAHVAQPQAEPNCDLESRRSVEKVNLAQTERLIVQSQEIDQLNRNLYTGQWGIIRLLTQVLQLHNVVLWEHSKRVAVISRIIAKQLGFSPINSAQLEIGALLHDIGKLGISSQVLKKQPDTLSDKETALLKSHPIQGEALLSLLPAFTEAVQYIRHHHEKFDGTGYPDGFKGKEIPLGARIIAVANAYDHLLYEQRHRLPVSPEEAFQQMVKLNPLAFDPDVVAVLKQAMTEKCWMLPNFNEVNKSLDTPKQQSLERQSNGNTVPPIESLSIPESMETPIITGQQQPDWSDLLQSDLTCAEEALPIDMRQDAMNTDALFQKYPETPVQASKAIHPEAFAKHRVSRLNTSSVRRQQEPSVSIQPRVLGVGMILAEDLYSPDGVKLLPMGTVIKKEYLDRLRHYFLKYRTNYTIRVYQAKYVPLNALNHKN